MQRRKELLALARQYDFLIMEGRYTLESCLTGPLIQIALVDDPYYYLYYGDGPRPESYFTLEAQDDQPVGRVIRFDSLSKILSAGMFSHFLR